MHLERRHNRHVSVQCDRWAAIGRIIAEPAPNRLRQLAGETHHNRRIGQRGRPNHGRAKRNRRCGGSSSESHDVGRNRDGGSDGYFECSGGAEGGCRWCGRFRSGDGDAGGFVGGRGGREEIMKCANGGSARGSCLERGSRYPTMAGAHYR